MAQLPVIKFRATPDDLERADRLAAVRGVCRAELLRRLLWEASKREQSGAPDSDAPTDEPEGIRLLRERARGGHMPAIRELVRIEAEQQAARERERRRADGAARWAEIAARGPGGGREVATEAEPSPFQDR